MVSPLNQTWKSCEERRWSPTKTALDCETNSPCQPLWKCLKKSKETGDCILMLGWRVNGLNSGVMVSCVVLSCVSEWHPNNLKNHVIITIGIGGRAGAMPPSPPKQKLWTLGEKDRVRDPPPTLHLLHTCFELNSYCKSSFKLFCLKVCFNCSMRFVLHKIICLLMHWISGLQPQ